MDKTYKGVDDMKKTAIVTGGSRGIGEAIVYRLAKMGYRIAFNYHSDHSAALAEKICKEVSRKNQTEVIAVQGDVGKYSDCKELIRAAVGRFGDTIDVLVNNSGITNGKSYLSITVEEYERLISTNLLGVMHMCHLALPHMIGHDACMINMSSVNGLTPSINQADYCAAKAGIIGFTRALALEYADRGLRVNAIAPGLIKTDMLSCVDQEELKAAASTIPLGRIGDTSDIAGCVEYIINAPYLTGQTISPNGGFVMH